LGISAAAERIDAAGDVPGTPDRPPCAVRRPDTTAEISVKHDQ